MKELLKRSVFGLLYVLVVIFSLQSLEGKTLLMAFFLAIGLKEFSKLRNLHYSTVLLPAMFVFLSSFIFNYTPMLSVKVLHLSVAFMLIALFIPLIYFIFDKISSKMIADFYLAVFYLAVPFSIALAIDNKLLLAVFVIIWASDSFAYLTGKYFGKHKLAEKISPKKTIEGLLGGMSGSLLTAYLLYRFTDWMGDLNLIKFLLLALIIVVFGTLGDLLQSRFKRLAGVKDSGNLIPGHGGILDRLDSFILAIPFVFAYILIV